MSKLNIPSANQLVISLDSVRERRETARMAQRSSSVLIEDSALLLAASFALVLCNGIDLEPPLRRAPERIYVVLREMLQTLAGTNSAMLPELFDERLGCIREEDCEGWAFDRFVERNYDGDSVAAMRLIARLRLIEPRAGLPGGAGVDVREWADLERTRAVAWLRCLERLRSVVTVAA